MLDRPVQTISNIHARPFPLAGGGTTASVTWRSSSNAVALAETVTCADGTQGIRLTRQTSAAAAVYNGQGVGALWQEAKNNWKVGDKWTISFWARASEDTALGHLLGYSTGSQNHLASSEAFTLLSGQLTECRRVLTVTQAMIDTADNAMNKWTIPTTLSVGGWIEISRMMVVQGVYDGPFVSGDTPGWIWLSGIANQGASAGAPYTLESITGTQWFTSNTPGVTSFPAGAPDTGLTFFTVYNEFSSGAPNNKVLASFGEPSPVGSGAGVLTFRVGNTGVNQITTRAQGLPLDGVAASVSAANTTRADGFHIFASIWNHVNAVGSAQRDGNALVSSAASAAVRGAGFPGRSIYMAPPDAFDVVLGVHATTGVVPSATRDLVRAWLRNRYGLAA